jgi:hypothetical protein
MKKTIQVVIILMLISCSIKKQTGNNDAKSDCQIAMSIFEKEFLSSCPISNGADAVINYLEEFQGYSRNKKFDLGNGSVRFNAKDALIYGYPVLDEKSLYLLNFSPNLKGYESWILFQAIYFFERKEDKDAVLNQMKKAIIEDLKLSKEVKFTLANEPYERYYFPCGSGFNLKHGEVDGKFIIDILWARGISAPSGLPN